MAFWVSVLTGIPFKVAIKNNSKLPLFPHIITMGKLSQAKAMQPGTW